MKPIYRFDFNPDIGCVDNAVIITDYEKRHDGRHEFIYNDPFLKTHAHKFIDTEDFNHFSNNRVYLWENDKSTAIKIIGEGLEKRVSDIYSKYVKAQNILNSFKEGL